MEQGGEITVLLKQVSRGDKEASSRLMPLLYDELRKIAAAYFRRERLDHTLQPTALVHEAYLRLIDQRDVQWQNRKHFFGIAAQIMRRILLDHARSHVAAKRGGMVPRVTFDEAVLGAAQQWGDVIAVDEALTRLSKFDAQQERIVELRFFGGLSMEETADVLRVSPATVKRDWAMAKAWLARELDAHKT